MLGHADAMGHNKGIWTNSPYQTPPSPPHLARTLCSYHWWKFSFSTKPSKLCDSVKGEVESFSESFVPWFSFSFIFFKDFIYLFLERGKEGEREGEKHQCVVASAPNQALTHNSGMCPDWESNWWHFGSQAGAQSTEPHQPGLDFLKIIRIPKWHILGGGSFWTLSESCYIHVTSMLWNTL